MLCQWPLAPLVGHRSPCDTHMDLLSEQRHLGGPEFFGCAPPQLQVEMHLHVYSPAMTGHLHEEGWGPACNDSQLNCKIYCLARSRACLALTGTVIWLDLLVCDMTACSSCCCIPMPLMPIKPSTCPAGGVQGLPLPAYDFVTINENLTECQV